jgi:aryl-phospho-beta-D-glucosidase BglC (GH1 family)
MKIFLSIVLFLSVFVSGAQTRQKAFEINQQLGRGINFGNMFEAPTETEWGNPWQPGYAKKIADLGFDHVRIPIRWEPAARSSATPPYSIQASFLNRIRQVVDSALSNGLHAIINMHHHEALFANPDAQKERFLAQWKQISQFFKTYPDSLLFEILNEPNGNLTAEKWNVFAADALATIRDDSPERTVVIGTPEWGGLGGLSKLQIPDDENIILTIHYYNPFTFTHQGAEWSEGSEAWLGTTWNDSETERDVVQQEFSALRTLSLQKNIPVHIGEFGAYQKADMVSRVKWTTFLSRYFEQQNWSWAYWEFSAGFGIYNPSDQTYRQELVDALLHNPMPEPARYVGTPVYTSNFQSSTDGWTLNKQGGATGQLSNSENALKVTITSGGTEGWHVQLVKNDVALQSGKTYRLSFKAKAETSRSFSAYIGMSVSPWSSYSGYHSLTAADTFAVYTFIFDMNETVNNARMVFDLGNSNADFTVTEVLLEEIVLEFPNAVNDVAKVQSRIYPNPVNQKLFIENNDRFEEAVLFDLSGKILFKTKLTEHTSKIDVERLRRGIYILELTSGEKQYSVKIVR